MKKHKDFCQSCGHRITLPRWETLNSGLVQCLIKGIQAVHRNRENRFHYVRDTGIGRIAAANFQKLRFHGLIAHFDPENQRSGEWLITAQGGKFLRGEIVIPKKILVFDNRITEHGTELVHINQIKNLPQEFDSKFAYEVPLPVIRNENISLFQKR